LEIFCLTDKTANCSAGIGWTSLEKNKCRRSTGS